MRPQLPQETVISIHVRALLAAPIVICCLFGLRLLIRGSGAPLEVRVFDHGSMLSAEGRAHPAVPDLGVFGPLTAELDARGVGRKDGEVDRGSAQKRRLRQVNQTGPPNKR